MANQLTPPQRTPPRNKGLIRPYQDKNQWFLSALKKAGYFWGGVTLGGVGWPAMFMGSWNHQQMLGWGVISVPLPRPISLLESFLAKDGPRFRALSRQIYVFFGTCFPKSVLGDLWHVQIYVKGDHLGGAKNPVSLHTLHCVSQCFRQGSRYHPSQNLNSLDTIKCHVILLMMLLLMPLRTLSAIHNVPKRTYKENVKPC